MNRDQLLDAIGRTDESMLKEIEQLRLGVDDASAGSATVTRMHRPARRRLMLVLAACLVLLLGTVGAYATGLIGRRSGTVQTGTNAQGDAVMVFTPDEDMRVPLSSIHGDVKNTTQTMQSQWTKNPATGEYEWTGSNDGLRSNKPGIGISQLSFNTLAEATAFIGYDGLVTPVFNENVQPQVFYVYSTGKADNLDDPGPDPEYNLDFISIMSYYIVDGINVSLNSYLITEYFENPRAVDRLEISSENGDVQLTSETVLVNNREFQVVHQNFGDPATTDDGYQIPQRIFDTYIWAENKVEYQLDINYAESDRSRAEQIIADWMNSFTD